MMMMTTVRWKWALEMIYLGKGNGSDWLHSSETLCNVISWLIAICRDGIDRNDLRVVCVMRCDVMLHFSMVELTVNDNALEPIMHESALKRH